MPFVFLFGAMLIVMLLRIAPPIGVRIDGEPVGKVTLSMRERVRLQRTNIYAIGAMLLVTALAGNIPLFVEVIVIAGVLAILMIPVRYVLTTEGLALNRTVFRHWTEFRGVEADAAGVKLVPVDGVRQFRLVLSSEKAAVVARSISQLLATASRDGDGAPRTSTTTRTGRGSRARDRQRRRLLASSHF